MDLVVVGMSHIEALAHGWDKILRDYRDVRFRAYNLRRFLRKASDTEIQKFRFPVSERESRLLEEARQDPPLEGTCIEGYIRSADIAECFKDFIVEADAIAFLIDGNEHNIVGLLDIHPLNVALRITENAVRQTLDAWLGLLVPISPRNVSLLLPPPPNGSEEHVLRRADRAFQGKLVEHSVRNSQDRLAIWRRQCEVIWDVARTKGLGVVELPRDVFSADGLLAEDCYGNDATHGNDSYGARVMREIVRVMAGNIAKAAHPYTNLADSAYWRQAVSEPSCDDIDPLVDPVFVISPTDKVATAGSCFAQHISKRLRESGYNYFVAEQPASGVDGERLGFYDFSARYGNVYTSRQLVQLFDRAFGYFVPQDRVWSRPGGGYCDPFRPRIEPDGFPERGAVLEDAERHLTSVRRMFSELDVFVFTLGLTECWRSRLDGAVYPLAPGVAGGRFDPALHEFVNLGVSNVVADMKDFLRKLRYVNPTARVVLTVSPVPLVATYERRHVLTSTMYSKSVLRVAAEEVSRDDDKVQYFPSYEIIMGPHAGGRYFELDLRGVTRAGVDHVMKVFMSRMTALAPVGDESRLTKPLRGLEELQEIRSMMEASCDEEMYAKSPEK